MHLVPQPSSKSGARPDVGDEFAAAFSPVVTPVSRATPSVICAALNRMIDSRPTGCRLFGEASTSAYAAKLLLMRLNLMMARMA